MTKIAAENLYDWLDHPVTIEYRKRLAKMADQARDVRNIDHTQSLVEIGGAAIASINYVAAIDDALNTSIVFPVSELTE